MNPIKIALQWLTFLKFKIDAPTRDDQSRALAYFPVVGILMGTCLVYADQILGRWLPVLVNNFILLIILFLFRERRGLINAEMLSRSILVRILFWALRGLILCVIPNPLRWISLIFMTTFSSGALSIALKRLQPDKFDFENVFWACFSLIFFSVVCGPLGFFVLGVSSGVLAFLLRGPARRLDFMEGTLEVSVLWAVFFFHGLWKFY